jgi:hypothetical protein
MEKSEMVLEVLKTTGCLTANEIKGFVYRKFGESISPNSAAAAVRSLIKVGKAGVSQNEKGQKVYWLVKNC